jgi:hypothetical protein
MRFAAEPRADPLCTIAAVFDPPLRSSVAIPSIQFKTIESLIIATDMPRAEIFEIPDL